jgi:hypothetical protein
VRKAKKAALTQKAPRAKKAAKTRAKNARFRAKMAKTIEARQQAEQATIEKRAKPISTWKATSAIWQTRQSWPCLYSITRIFLVRGRPARHHGPALPGKLLRARISARVIEQGPHRASDRPPGSPPGGFFVPTGPRHRLA